MSLAGYDSPPVRLVDYPWDVQVVCHQVDVIERQRPFGGGEGQEPTIREHRLHLVIFNFERTLTPGRFAFDRTQPTFHGDQDPGFVTVLISYNEMYSLPQEPQRLRIAIPPAGTNLRFTHILPEGYLPPKELRSLTYDGQVLATSVANSRFVLRRHTVEPARIFLDPDSELQVATPTIIDVTGHCLWLGSPTGQANIYYLWALTEFGHTLLSGSWILFYVNDREAFVARHPDTDHTSVLIVRITDTALWRLPAYKPPTAELPPAEEEPEVVKATTESPDAVQRQIRDCVCQLADMPAPQAAPPRQPHQRTKYLSGTF